MNPNLCRVALRPRDPFEVFDLAIRLSRERWRPLGRIGFVFVLPLLLVCVPLTWFSEGHVMTLAWPLLISVPLQAPFTVAVGRLLFDDDVTLGTVFSDLWARSGALIGTWFVSLLAFVSTAVTCGVAWPFVAAFLGYLTEAALLERVSVTRSVRRSLRLAGANMGAAISNAWSAWGLTLWFALLGEMTGQFVVNWVLQMGEPFGSAQHGDVTPYLLAGMIVAQPVHATLRLLLYVDVRTRVEGWDLQVALRAAALGRTP